MTDRLYDMIMVIGCVLLTLIGCTSKVSTGSSKTVNNTLDSVIEELEKDREVKLNIEYNETKDFVLLTDSLSKKGKVVVENLNNILIVRLYDNKIIFREQIRGGRARWINAYELEIFYPSGIPDLQRCVIMNVKSGVKRSKNQM